MRWSAAVLAVVAGVVPALLRADDEVSGDLKKMQGTWVSAGQGPESRWVIKGNTLEVRVNEEDYTCSLTLDPKTAPHPSADIMITKGPGDSPGKSSKAIYKFDGGHLFICVTHPGGANRPTDFKSAENEAILFELKPEP
jgi:uncharacterized protein (TIGR03067 family)